MGEFDVEGWVAVGFGEAFLRGGKGKGEEMKMRKRAQEIMYERGEKGRVGENRKRKRKRGRNKIK